MDCDDIQRQLHARTPLAGDAAAHLAGCPACAAMVAAATHLPVPAAGQGGAADHGLWAATAAALEREQGPVAWVRERSVLARLGLALAVALVAPLAVLALWPRTDLAIYPRVRLVVELAALALAWLLAAAVTLRPLQRALPDATRLAVAGLAVLVAVLLATVPPAHDAAFHLSGSPLVHALSCLLFGTLCALPAWLALRVVAREGERLGRRAQVLAAAAVVVGVAGVFLHCPILDRSHLWAGHVTIGVPLLLWAGWHARRSARAR